MTKEKSEIKALEEGAVKLDGVRPLPTTPKPRVRPRAQFPPIKDREKEDTMDTLNNFTDEQLEKELEKRRREAKFSALKLAEPYNNSYGLWRVTTEGDCEGKTTLGLGVHEGHIDEIARKLGRKACYKLRFTSICAEKEEETPEAIPAKEVHISLGIESRTWDMSSEERAHVLSKLLSDRPVEVVEGRYYASVKLIFPEDEQQ